jgi:hypothetical protein
VRKDTYCACRRHREQDARALTPDWIPTQTDHLLFYSVHIHKQPWHRASSIARRSFHTSQTTMAARAKLHSPSVVSIVTEAGLTELASAPTGVAVSSILPAALARGRTTATARPLNVVRRADVKLPRSRGSPLPTR